ncbi:nuclear transport factor 2 family protein [Chitinibacter sp. ZOR0017]|uniref:nuclear transport factor 2 family protein n=1 Tax=Chitinibacter sp. ZOR0017 TaxID=1339254 RepID=UPI0018CC9799|nr:nuclear transport factor 2 family protein [Chitinibacter sp. ZOR0017]
MQPNEIRALVDRYIDAYNRMDIDAMLSCMHPQVEFKNIAGGVVNASTEGIEALKQLAQQSLALFSARQQRIEAFEILDGVAHAHIAFHAVVASDLPNGLQQGQILNFSGRSEFEFWDGLIGKITDIS